jgi:hypothetical protein
MTRRGVEQPAGCHRRAEAKGEQRETSGGEERAMEAWRRKPTLEATLVEERRE